MAATEAFVSASNANNEQNALNFFNSDQPNSIQSESSGHSSIPTTPLPSYNQLYECTGPSSIKCSAVHTLERDMPDFDYTNLIRELRQLILNDIEQNPGIYSQSDIQKCRHDDWYLARYLLRNKLIVSDAFDMLRKSMRFSHESLINELRQESFPAEFYQLGAVFSYEPDRKGNAMLYLRVALNRKTEIAVIIQGFIFFHLKRLDEEVKGRGISIVIDCTGAGLANADVDLLIFIVTTIKNYFPKGLSYFLIHELPWILKPIWHIAKQMIPEEHKQLIKFSDSKTIFEYVNKENLPDFMGGTCTRNYRQVPENCMTIEQAMKLWGIDYRIGRNVLSKFEKHLPIETVKRVYTYFDEREQYERDCIEAERAKSK